MSNNNSLSNIGDAVNVNAQYDEVQALHHELPGIIRDNPDVYARIDAYNALDKAMQRGTAEGQRASLLALKAELTAPVIDTCPTCKEGSGGCCCDLPSVGLEAGEELPL